MNIDPLLSAPLVIQLHVVSALSALIIGTAQLVGAKGSGTHRLLGYAWVALMLAVAISSFWIRSSQHWYGFSLIHVLSVLTLISVPLATYAAHRGRIRRHRIAMINLFWLALVVTGLFTLLPGRLMHQVLIG